MGKSSNAPCPNLKKLIIPASTAATTTIFLPAFSTAKGLVLRGAVCGGGGVDVVHHVHGESRLNNDCLMAGAVDGAGRDDGGVDLSVINVRRRGTGGGSSGRMSKRSFSSERDGTGVVRALKGEQQLVDRSDR